MKWAQHNLERAQQKFVFAGHDRGSTSELVRVVGNEVSTGPVALEDGYDLGNSIGITGFGESHIPFEPSHLRRVGEVRRADVGGRIATRSVEQPSFGMKSGK